MKNYRMLVPVALIAFMAMAVYTMFSTYGKQNKQYKDYIEQARIYSSQGIMNDAVFMYQEALKLYDTLDIQIEMCNTIRNLSNIENAISMGEEMLKKYKSAAANAYMLGLYIEAEKFEEAYQLYDKAESSDDINQEVKELMSSIEYAYTFQYNYYRDAKNPSLDVSPIMKDDLWGFSDASGALLVEPKFTSVYPYTVVEADGEKITCAAVEDIDGTRYYIDGKGNKKYIVKNIEQCTFLGPYSDGVLVAADGAAYAYYNLDFEKISQDYTYATTMNGGCAAVQINEEWHVIDSEYQIQGETYDEIAIDGKEIAFRNERAFGMQNGQYYLIDMQGAKVSSEGYEAARPFLSDAYAAVKKGEKWGFIDANGKMVIEPQYEDADSFSNGLATVKINGKWGFVDLEGNVAIPCEFDGAKNMNTKGNAYILEDETWKMLSLYKYNH